MIIDFNKMDVTVLPNFKGGEKEFAANMFFDGTNRIFKGRLIPGATIGMHTHEDSCEVIFILEGHGTVVEIAPEAGDSCDAAAGESCDAAADKSASALETATPVGPGDCLYCPKGHTHSLRNTSAEGDLVFYAVVPMQ
jgi:mannose-6-phosphate isomerase-like protein (cupin superfamily)